jgi:5-methylcytosine-specific restriction endonuclease McrA
MRKKIDQSAKIRMMLIAGSSTREIIDVTSVGKSTVSFHAHRIGIRSKTIQRGVISICFVCGKRKRNDLSRRCCSRACATQLDNYEFIHRWKTGLDFGYNTWGQLKKPIRRYILERDNHACVLCGWNKVNTFTGSSPLIVDHIDGNWQNCAEDNLRTICPNCDSLTSTHKSLNRGNGRPRMRLHRQSVALSNQ